MSDKLQFGQKVFVTGIMKRGEEERKYPGRQFTDTYRYWQKVSIPEYPLEAVFLGYRTKYDGVVERDEYQTTFHKKESHKCCLVCFGPKENPVTVPVEFVEEAE